MQANLTFLGLKKEFWANIRTISQKLGYTVRLPRRKGIPATPGPIKIPSLTEIQGALASLNLNATHLVRSDGKPTEMGTQVLAYFSYRADVLNRMVEPQLMNAEQARVLYEQIQKELCISRLAPMNKQSDEKKKPAYFTAIINMLIESNLSGLPCNYDPQTLTTITLDRAPFRTMARRVDGAFPGPVDPIAVWEIKEYYYTTTFGSRVADGVYETLLDGMELEELDAALQLSKAHRRPDRIRHLLMVDAHYTWWTRGRPYLCRIIDMLHMGYVDEVLFGKEVVEELPRIVQGWVATQKRLRG